MILNITTETDMECFNTLILILGHLLINFLPKICYNEFTNHCFVLVIINFNSALFTLPSPTCLTGFPWGAKDVRKIQDPICLVFYQLLYHAPIKQNKTKKEWGKTCHPFFICTEICEALCFYLNAVEVLDETWDNKEKMSEDGSQVILSPYGWVGNPIIPKWP